MMPKMKKLTIKQWLVIYLIKFLDSLTNSDLTVVFFNYLCNFFKINFLTNSKIQKNSIFKNFNVAFICDGNRRFTKKKNKIKMISASDDLLNIKELNIDNNSFKKYNATNGFIKIMDLIHFAYKHQFKEISFFCFSVKNFQRKKTEINDIMNFIKINSNFPENTKIPVKIQIYGDLRRLDKEIQDIFNIWTKHTANVDGLIVNLFFSYASTEEYKYDIKYDKKVDIIIRTGNMKRLSDFMLKQACFGSAIYFVKPLWPEYSVIHFYLTLYKYILEEKYLKRKIV